MSVEGLTRGLLYACARWAQTETIKLCESSVEDHHIQLTVDRPPSPAHSRHQRVYFLVWIPRVVYCRDLLDTCHLHVWLWTAASKKRLKQGQLAALLSKELGYKHRALTHGDAVMNPLEESPNLSVSLHNWVAVGIQDGILTWMRKCFPKPRGTDSSEARTRDRELPRGQTVRFTPLFKGFAKPLAQTTYTWWLFLLSANTTETHTEEEPRRLIGIRSMWRVGGQFRPDVRHFREMDWDSAHGFQMSQNVMLIGQWID